jgi:hypothetical protein
MASFILVSIVSFLVHSTLYIQSPSLPCLILCQSKIRVNTNLFCYAEDGLLSFLRHHDWEILVLEARLHVPSDGDEQNTLVKVNLASDCALPSTSDEYEQPESESQGD